ncbi:hypothetical protein NQ318_008465 [Aromia moschata]|uniref:DDE Tnp4 domain-containing protein n=1 Tax=Aromia moschata TaxID=1265417 RepID=A0AAV8Y9K7_9CUCU|nr:hypothetical protein NQ318_008465 [Aromia moschata]
MAVLPRSTFVVRISRGTVGKEGTSSSDSECSEYSSTSSLKNILGWKGNYIDIKMFVSDLIKSHEVLSRYKWKRKCHSRESYISNDMSTAHRIITKVVNLNSLVVIEHAFGLLKHRFRRLKFFENDNLEFIVKCVIACTVLHNVCLKFNDLAEYDPEEDNDA